jgi:hypothetical protein
MSEISSRPARILTNPARSLFWAGVWLVIGAVGAFLFFAAGGFPLFATTTSYTSSKGLITIASLPVIGAVAAVFLIVGAVRRIGPYRAQEQSPAGIALRAEADAVTARKHYVVLFVFGILFALVWVFITLFVVLGLLLTDVEASTVLVLAFILFLFGLIAAGLLGTAVSRRGARRRVAARAEPAGAYTA